MMMQCASSYVPLHYYYLTRDRDRDRDQNEAAFPFVPGYVLRSPSLCVNDDKWRIRWIMQSHEAAFKHQVQELHRLYERQRNLMNELKPREHCSQVDLRLPPQVQEERKWLVIDLNQQPPVSFASEEEDDLHHDDPAEKSNSPDGLNCSMAIDLNSLPLEEEDDDPLPDSDETRSPDAAAETLVMMMMMSCPPSSPTGIEDCVLLHWFADIAATYDNPKRPKTTTTKRRRKVKRVVVRSKGSCRRTRRKTGSKLRLVNGWGEKRKRGASKKHYIS